MSDLLKGLNKEQKEAVLHTDGPLLILAGAGSGKTSVLTRKIAYLLEKGKADEFDILAFTFTNKAASEMKERVADLLNKEVDHMWIGTFHSICSRILRRNIDKLGYKNTFSIYDTTDSRSLVKDIMKDLRIDEKYTPIREVIAVISDNKNKFISPEESAENAFYEKQRNIAEIYKIYEKRKKINNALDFDDLILKTIELLEKDQETRDFYSRKFKYVFVDEYQDTNQAQYRLIRLFTKKYKNICVVGDSDQSIYSWRGADISNILNFEEDYKDARVILLEQNYRSTNKILDAANDLIANNLERKDKNLWTANKKEFPIVYRNSATEYDEAEDLVLKIQQMANAGYDLNEMAILYRTNAQSRVLEEKLMQNHINHKIIGGLKFYDRKEVKDIIAYLALIANPDDNVALKRVVNTPKRGIGDTTLSKLEFYANNNGESMFDSIYSDGLKDSLSKATISKLRNFADTIMEFIQNVDNYLVTDLLLDVYEKSGYKKMLEDSKRIEDKSKIENLSALTDAVQEFERRNEEATLYDYLQNVNLLSDVDKTEENDRAISLMTIHSAKGLEYDVVFLTGMEEGLFPSLRTMEEGGLEEERRLAYVAVTRAKERLFVSSAASRTVFGKRAYIKRSRFIDEIYSHLDEEKAQVNDSFSSANTYFDQFDSFEAKRERIRQEIQEKKKRFEDNLQMDFNIGDKVDHKKFGQGMVISVERKDNGDELLVNFDKSGLKRLNAKLAKLKKL
ncbi:UvrD-helicase domain-containing protein [uncultured Helcococcus sp.]|uniref:ATP-dependent helicase n=1 Tax=uncultured Helcococcus sp. TaxID=1072508 RepID=UPI00288AA913|nr:UvrD-helicase domain-containing protein [uncultured Helcococcus sp.]